MSIVSRLYQSRISQFIFALVCIGAPFVLSNAVLKLFPADDALAPLRNGFKIVVLISAYTAYQRWVAKRSPFELSLSGAPKEAGFGFLLGAVVIGASVAVLGALGAYRVEGINADVAWFRYVTGFFAVAMLEEMIFRVFLFRLVEAYLGTVISILLTAALFGLAHMSNANATWLSTASLTITGLILVGGFLLTRRLWFCFGIHWSWNLVQAVNSLPVSGNATKGVLNGQIMGPTWLTGGEFGIEASVVTLSLSVIASGVLLNLAFKRGHAIAPYWKVERS